MNIEQVKSSIGKEVEYLGNDPDLLDHCSNTRFLRSVKAYRDSLSKAMGDLYELKPDIDLQKIQQNEIWFLIERFLASECLNRLCHDIGQVMESSEFKPEVIIQRMDEMRDYLEADLKSNLEVLRADLPHPSNKDLQQVLEKSLENTFSLYEGEI